MYQFTPSQKNAMEIIENDAPGVRDIQMEAENSGFDSRDA
jgi:hypothetical protein